MIKVAPLRVLWSAPKSLARVCLGILLSSALIACPSQPNLEYKLSSILPAPVTPGDAVTAFGVFPSDAAVFLNETPVSSLAVRDGLRFSVPATFVSQDAKVEVRGAGIALPSSISVNPRLNGTQIKITGAGWVGASDVILKVNGSPLAWTADGDAITATLPASTVYGVLSVSLEVGKHSSNVKGLLLEAGAISGQVIPVTPKVASARVSNRSREAIPTNAWLVQGDARTVQSFTTNAESVKSLAGLNSTRFAFSSVTEAQQAFQNVQHHLPLPGIQSLEWDQQVTLAEAGTVIPAPSPKRSGISKRTTGNTIPTPPAEQWFLELQGIPNAWSVTQGKGVTVAIVDTGVNLEHPDLKPNLLPGYDFVDDDAEPMDIAGHGTHVAGLVAAHGLALGVALEASLLPIRVLRDLSGGSISTVAQGILWAANLLPDKPNPHPADIINLSLGSNEYSSLLENVIARVQAQGVLVVAAAGNNGGALSYPAGFAGVVSVTALAGPLGGNLSYQPSYASRGTGLKLTAVGGDTTQDQNADGLPDGVYSTDLTDSGYGLRMGTSMAAPQVAGLAALARSGGTPRNLLSEVLARTATDLGVRGFDLNFGFGLISGRAATGLLPRTYAAAVDASGQIRGWSLVQKDGSYLIDSLPPGLLCSVLIGSDDNGNGVIGETGEFIGQTERLTTTTKQVISAGNTTLNSSNGTQTFRLIEHQ
jgi:serine protease